MKIAIIGYSGSGKSTLAAQIGASANISVCHMDQLHWLPGWKERDHKEEVKLLEAFLKEQENWVIDGNYHTVLFDERMELADQILFLNFSRFRCLFRAIKRYLQNKEATRTSMTEGCEEKIDWEFVRWILHDGRTKQTKAKYQMLMDLYADKIIEIKNQKQLDQILQTYI